MKISKPLVMYTRTGCHLCEQAQAVIEPWLQPYGLELASIEIADSDDLLERYGVRIPVVRLEGAAQDLGWPFDGDALRHYLDSAVAAGPG